MFHRTERVLHHILHPQVDIYLMQHIPHAQRRHVSQHDEPQIGGCLVVVELVLRGSVTDEGVVGAAEFADHVSEGEDGAKD